MKKIHLICNAHIDPVWQWEWEEGAAAAVSTFRAAASFCEEFGGFVFNHNEVILYQWIEEYEPDLFRKIQKLVAEGKWHIMGGWYLQPDCNMPSGESFVRQILCGRQYFLSKFKSWPTTAINFDSFGHSRGLVQIMKKSGYDSYVFMRPDFPGYHIQPGDFNWIGFDGSEILCHKIEPGYNTPMGKADQKIKDYVNKDLELPKEKRRQLGMVLWGVGNHGGGPSREDLRNIATLCKTEGFESVVHSTPENYFKDLISSKQTLPKVFEGLNPRFPGCYTSQIRIKQKHRLLENEFYLVEKMLSSATANQLLKYPKCEMDLALQDLLTVEFHDILPGSSIQPVEETSLRIADHGLEILSRLKARAFFAMATGQAIAKEGTYPILIYNTHPYKVKGQFECEFMLADQNWKNEFSLPEVYCGDTKLPSQNEKELSNLNLDWRKRVVFEAELEPSSMNRFDCKITIVPQKPMAQLLEKNGQFIFKTNVLEVIVNSGTGLIDSYKVEGVEYLKVGAFLPVVIQDNDDPWRMDVNRFDDVTGCFQLMDRELAAWYSGHQQSSLKPVRVIEDGEVRTVIEALFQYHSSQLVMTYKLPKSGTEIDVSIRVNWNEKSKMLKIALPTSFQNSDYLGQTAYGIDQLKTNGDEMVSQKWCAAVSKTEDKALTCINDGIYGSSCENSEIRLTLLRSPGYCAHPINERPILPKDRFLPRMDQGERQYGFRINVGNVKERLQKIDAEALVFAEKPYALSFFPSGLGTCPQQLIFISNPEVVMNAFKPSEDGKAYIFRLFNPCEASQTAKVELPVFGKSLEVLLTPYEIKTFRFDTENNRVHETDLTEKLLSNC